VSNSEQPPREGMRTIYDEVRRVAEDLSHMRKLFDEEVYR